MYCENCKALYSYTGFYGTERGCVLGVSEDKAYHEGTDTYSCTRSEEQIDRALSKKMSWSEKVWATS